MSLKPRFWKPGTDGPQSNLQFERTTDEDVAKQSVIYNPNHALSITQQRQRLPIFKYRNNILYMLEKYQTLILVGETGCGKSTQIPQYLYESGWAADGRVIGVTQPRRVAATTVAGRVAEEKGVLLGEEVGFSIRFDACCDAAKTRIKFMTDGMLLREMMRDPLLSQYSVLMIDEAHERGLYTDIVAGLLKKVLKRRPELRLIVSSATLDAELFRKFFNFNTTPEKASDTAAALSVEGRTYPVDTHYVKSPVSDYVKASVTTVYGIHKEQGPGDVLVFLTGQDEVEDVVRRIRERAQSLPDGDNELLVVPMYGGLPPGEQMKAFSRTPHGKRKIVVATNIAEASITINGIVYIVDCGYVKIKAYSPRTDIESLVTVPVSQASAQQRAGRAGRVRSGKAFRLYTEEQFHKLAPAAVPELQRTQLAPALLQLKSMGIDNVLRFDFVSAPPAKAMMRGLELLYALKAISGGGLLEDPLGVQMAEFPLGPMFSAMLLSSETFGCSEEAVTIAAMLQVHNVFVQSPRNRLEADKAKLRFSSREGDHLTLLNVYNAFLQYQKNSRWCQQNFLNHKVLCRVVEIRAQLCKLLRRCKVKLVSSGDDAEAVQRCVVAGFFPNAARYHASGCYKSIREDQTLHVHPTSVLFASKPQPWLLFNEIVETDRKYMRDVTVIDPEWLMELAPHFYQFGTEREVHESAAKRPRLQ
eukprot:scpid50983/ scgid28870/ Probable ATP-dependent RNA helicase DHX35; DEAH box protein 35